MNEQGSWFDQFSFLAAHSDLAIRQAVADQYSAPQVDRGTLKAAIEAAVKSDRWAK